MQVMWCLLGLKEALRKLLDRIGRPFKARFLVRFYCSDEKIFSILSKWGYGIRDESIMELVNSIRSLADEVGILDVVRSNVGRVEKKLREWAIQNYYLHLEHIRGRSRSRELSNRGGYIIYSLQRDSNGLPLEFLAEYLVRNKENQRWNHRGVIVMREDRAGEKSITKLYHYSFVEDGRIIEMLRKIDKGFRKCWAGRTKTFYTTSTPTDRIEEILVEVVQKV